MCVCSELRFVRSVYPETLMDEQVLSGAARDTFFWLFVLSLSILPLILKAFLTLQSRSPFYLVTAVLSAVPAAHRHFDELGRMSRLDLSVCILLAVQKARWNPESTATALVCGGKLFQFYQPLILAKL